MIRFECDYAEGAHEKILSMLCDTNRNQTPGYGMDEYCEQARDAIKKACKDESVDVHFLVGGTQTNKTVIASILRPFQGVLCADTGHINVHETGAIEALGHKVMAMSSMDGKITASQIKEAYEEHKYSTTREHTTAPGMVYLSFPTESGTLYTKKELIAIYEVCKECDLPLFIDGARLGYGIMAPGNDVTLEDITKYSDVFYIGGTKVGALFGEAVVIKNPALKPNFRYYIKQNGGLLAKGRLLGIQFLTLFTDQLYFEISKHANTMAMKIKQAFERKQISFLNDSITNQQFPILTQAQIKQLEEKFAFSIWESIDKEHTVVRFCTSWATKEEDVNLLVAEIEKL